MNTKRILFRLGALLFLVAVSAIMMVIGRGHTVYIDNKTLEYNGQTYETPYKVVVFHDGEQVAKLYNKERGMTTCIGQQVDLTLEITQEKGGSEQTTDISLKLPYGMDGIAINLPAYLAGLPEEAYLSEFQPAPDPVESADESDEIITDEFALGDI